MLGRTPDGILAVRPLKDGVIADFDVTEKMLRFFLKTIIDRHLFRVKPKVIVCVPSGITEVEKRAVRDSAQSAGAKEVYMVAEPMAAAIGVGLPVETPTGNMVIDIGGGTTEIAVIALSGIVSDTSIRTGGDELDQAIVQFMRKNYNLLIGEPTAEQIKIQIGSAAPVGEEREMEVKGRDLVSGIPKIVRVHSSEIREAVQEPIQQIVDALRRALESTPPELASDIVDRGSVMTGGGMRQAVLPPFLASQQQTAPLSASLERYDAVVAQRDSAALAATFLPGLRGENARLRSLLGLGTRLSSGYVPAEVLHEPDPSSALTFAVSAGKKQGVKPLSAVVSPDGLVGIVSSVDAKTSVVVSWAHPEFRASAMAADGSVYGIVAPHGTEGPRIWLLELQGVAYRQLVPTGTMILTSGLGGVLPRGIPIGTVVGLAGEAEGWERTYLIRPAVHPAAVTHVMILTGPPVRGDLRALFESSGETP